MVLKKKNKFLKRFIAFTMCLIMVFGYVTVIEKPLEINAASTGYNEDYAWQVLDMVNQERAQAGLPALTMDAKLIASAKVRAVEITSVFDHTRPDGSSCFTAFPSGLGWRGENIAAGQRSPGDVMNGWMNSAGHKANILSSNFKSIGIACYYVPGSKYGYYWVQCFGGTVLEAASQSNSSTVYGGVDYSAVYNYDYYINKYSDLKTAFGSNSSAALAHFVNFGMSEGRQASADFNVTIYKNNYTDLQRTFGNNLKSYYLHYINNGKSEGRNAKTIISGSSGGSTASTPGSAPTVYNGVDYSAVYDYNYYINKYGDLRAAFGSNSSAALAHFVNNGMKEGRQACAAFNVQVYKSNYSDLRNAFGNDLRSYYLHYIRNGKKENRNAVTLIGSGSTGSTGSKTSVYDGVDYSAVYDYNYYINRYSDLKSAFGNDSSAALAHFVRYGMSEGRQAKEDFNVTIYKNRYADLQKAFGDDLKQYYLHYIRNGVRENRSAK
ncbi:MAG: hypothetical protein IJ224_04620 [Lachnospiraceae bacterium]|nr:hypothetical protein [Lachnospiraceae bacterium]